MRVGFLGACGLAIALIMLFNGDARPVHALAGVVVGALVAAFAWRRSWVILDRADDSPTAPAPYVRSGGFSEAAQSALLR